MNSELISIKGTRNGLVIVFDPNKEFEDIRNTLLSKMESARGFFKGANFSLLGKHHDIPPHQKTELENICKQYGLVPYIDKCNIMATTAPAPTDKKLPAAISCDLGEAALLVKRSLRSGQRVVHRGHIVIMGDIHPGAEVISGGNVLVMGSCRGVIHAGAWGEDSARVVAQRLSPTVLSIGGRRCPPEIVSSPPAGCNMARLHGQEVVFDQYQTTR